MRSHSLSGVGPPHDWWTPSYECKLTLGRSIMARKRRVYTPEFKAEAVQGQQLGQALGVVAVVLALGAEEQPQLAGVGHQDPGGQRLEQVVVVAVAAARLVAHLQAI